MPTIIFSERLRYGMVILVISLFLILLSVALSIPFLFESSSMLYKFGMEKSSLRFGKMLGLAAGLLILLQLPLAGRLKFLDRIFSLPLLMRQHRAHALVIALMVVAHPLFILLTEGKILLPLEIRYWPEWVGAALLAVVLLQFASSQWRMRFAMPFHRWLLFHRITGLLIAVLLIVHTLSVSETFTESGLPRWGAVASACCFLLLWLWIRTSRLRRRLSSYQVSAVTRTGFNCVCVEMKPVDGTPFVYLPGQFAFVSFRSSNLSSEFHPFTLSSTPTRAESLQLTIRSRGDWTRRVKRLQPGDTVSLHGPFGRFCHLYAGANRELVLIAGGVGITPMLSMLRYMADRGDSRPITLIWSNRTPEYVVYSHEMDRLALKLTGLRRVPIFTRTTGRGRRTARLDRPSLKPILKDCSRDAVVYLCGPPTMMDRLRKDLKMLGFPSRSIKTESFG